MRAHLDPMLALHDVLLHEVAVEVGANGVVDETLRDL
jgi:hypothetical protein